MAKFETIGVGFPTKSKKGVNYIAIKLDKEAMGAILTEDLGKICVFKKQSKGGKDYYQVTAPMPDNYERPKYNPNSTSGKESSSNVAESRTSEVTTDDIPF